MKVNLRQVESGCIVAKDVDGLTDLPIVRENTVLTPELLNVLNMFLIEIVEVQSIKANGEKYIPTELKEEDVLPKQPLIEKNFNNDYLNAVKEYKKLFQSWQAGNKVEMLNVRKILSPLFDSVVEQPHELVNLHHLSTKEDYLFHHSIYVGILSFYLGLKMDYKQGDYFQIGYAGVLADAGMAKIAPSILQKTGSLTAIEFEEIKKHPIYAYNMLKKVTGISDSILLAVLQHHERHDGSGYPLSTESSKIHPFSQIVAVADVYHAMTSERFYRSKRSPYQVIEDISKGQFGKFDLKTIQALVENIIPVSVGNRVLLSNGETAEIVFYNESNPTRPMVKLDSTGEIINLVQHAQLFINEVIN